MKKLLLYAALALPWFPAPAQPVFHLPVTRVLVRDTVPVRPGNFSVRTNLLYAALFTPTIGVEWRLSDGWGLKLDGSYGYWGGRNGKLHNAWLASPELRHYTGRSRRFYVGAGANAGGYDIYNLGPVSSALSSGTGYAGTLYSGGLVAGYQVRLSRSLSLDINAGFGYTHLQYDTYAMSRCASCVYKEYRDKDNTRRWFGPTQAGLSLVWHFGKPKGRPVPVPTYTPPSASASPVPTYTPPSPSAVPVPSPSPVLEAPQDVTLVMIEVSDMLFGFDSYSLEGAAIAELGRVAQWLHEHPSVRAEIGGHTDNTGTADYNRLLSENRARSVYDFLVSRGVSSARLTYSGYGLTRPVSDNATVEGRRRNRRVEIRVLK